MRASTPCCLHSVKTPECMQGADSVRPAEGILADRCMETRSAFQRRRHLRRSVEEGCRKASSQCRYAADRHALSVRFLPHDTGHGSWCCRGPFSSSHASTAPRRPWHTSETALVMTHFRDRVLVMTHFRDRALVMTFQRQSSGYDTSKTEPWL